MHTSGTGIAHDPETSSLRRQHLRIWASRTRFFGNLTQRFAFYFFRMEDGQRRRDSLRQWSKKPCPTAFKVEMETPRNPGPYLRKMRKYYIRVLPGDQVTAALPTI